MLKRNYREEWFDEVFPLTNGLVATDGVQYSAIATFGTTAVQILSSLIDPGFNVALKKIEVGLTQSFTGLNGSFVASMNYYWQVRSEYKEIGGTPSAPYEKQSALVNITGTYQKAVGTLAASEDTFSGYIPIGSLPYAPVRLILTAIGPDRAAVCQGRVKNSSYIRLVGNIIPGT